MRPRTRRRPHRTGLRRRLRRLLGLLLLGSAIGAGDLQAQRAPRSHDVEVPQGMQYVASTRGQTYYHADCHGWRSLVRANLRWFPTRQAAIEAGLRPSRQPGCAGPTDAVRPSRAGTCVVARIVDGDTFVCGEERIRLLLIDTPELDQAPYGDHARQALTRLIPAGTTVRVELDVRDRDRYGRVLAYVYGPDGRLVNEALVASGFAVVSVYPPNVRYVDRFRATQAAARAAGRGLWSGSAFDCRPAEHRAGRCPKS